MREELLQFQGVTVDPSVRKDLEEAYRTLNIDERILPVKEFRDDIKAIRTKTSDGTIILVSEGGRLKEPEDITVVLSFATLQQTLVRMIERGIASAARRRQRPADFLAGLPKVPKSAMTMDWELALAEDETPEESDLDI